MFCPTVFFWEKLGSCRQFRRELETVAVTCLGVTIDGRTIGFEGAV